MNFLDKNKLACSDSLQEKGTLGFVVWSFKILHYKAMLKKDSI